MRTPSSTLTSERLLLRRFQPADLDCLDRLNSNPLVMRYMGGPAPRADTEAMLSGRILAYYDQCPGLGVWATVECDSGACIGFHLINHIRGEAAVQVGYRLFPEFWGRGYATEMTRVLLRYGFADLGLPKIVAITHLDNRESQKVLVKSGLKRDGERRLSHPAYAEGALAWFERHREDWLAEPT